MKIYNGLAPNKKEVNIVKLLKPDYLMLSYFYWGNKNIKDIKNELGYNPHILYDSGAYSAKNKRKKIDIDKYISYLIANEKELDGYFTLDVIGNFKESLKNYLYIRSFGLSPIPVVHYKKNSHFQIEAYLKYKPEIIGIGDCARMKYSKLIPWLEMLKIMYPKQKFHLLAKTNAVLTGHGLYSADSTSWIVDAGRNKKPYFIDISLRNYILFLVYTF
jgi:hypothetical protein